MLTYSDISDLVDAGQTASQIATALADDHRTVRDLPMDHVRTLLFTEWSLVVTNPITRQRSGPLIDLYENPATPIPLRDGIRLLLGHIDNQSATIVETAGRADYASLWHAAVGLLGLTPEQHATLNTLHGGRRFEGVDAGAVQAGIDAHNEQQARDALTARVNAAVGAAQLAIEQGGDQVAVRDALLVAYDGGA